MGIPIVSVVIPAFNAAATIGRAVDLVLAQTYRNYEIIVIDDGSRDATADIVASHYGDRVRLLCLARNQGESAAMNHGIAAAEGELIAFLDADDEWLPDKLAKQVDALNRSPDAVMVSCACRFLDVRGDVFREFGMPPKGIDKNEVWRLLLAGSFIAKPCVVVRAAAFRKVGTIRHQPRDRCRSGHVDQAGDDGCGRIRARVPDDRARHRRQSYQNLCRQGGQIRPAHDPATC